MEIKESHISLEGHSTKSIEVVLEQLMEDDLAQPRWLAQWFKVNWKNRKMV